MIENTHRDMASEVTRTLCECVGPYDFLLYLCKEQCFGKGLNLIL